MGNNPAWKQLERDVAREFGGQRRGAYTGSASEGGRSDIIHDAWSIECKLRARPTMAEIEAAVRQAEAAAEPGQEPVAIIKRKGGKLEDALVVQRLATFRDWRLS